MHLGCPFFEPSCFDITLSFIYRMRYLAIPVLIAWLCLLLGSCPSVLKTRPLRRSLSVIESKEARAILPRSHLQSPQRDLQLIGRKPYTPARGHSNMPKSPSGSVPRIGRIKRGPVPTMSVPNPPDDIEHARNWLGEIRDGAFLLAVLQTIMQRIVLDVRRMRPTQSFSS